MTTKLTRIPPLNPLRFIPANEVLPVKYNNYMFDHGFFKQHIRPFEANVSYAQKFLLTDLLTIYFDTLAPGAKLHILNDRGVEVATAALSVFTIMDGNTDDLGNVYNTFLYISTFHDFGLSEGFYYFVIECQYSDASTYFVSECVQLKVKGFSNTVLLEYTNSENDYDVLFETFGSAIFSVRVEGAVTFTEPAGNNTVFEDMNQQVRRLQSIPYRLFKLTVGSSKGVPDWMIDKANHILACDYFVIDGMQYVTTDNSKVNMATQDIYPMSGASIELREYDNTKGWVFNFLSGATVDIVSLPLDDHGAIIYPFALTGLFLRSGITAVNSAPYIITNDASLGAYIDAFNATFAPMNSLAGTVLIADNIIKYANASGEHWIAIPNNSFCLPAFISGSFNVTVTTNAQIFQTLALGSAARVVMDYGDGSNADLVVVGPDDGSPLQVISHTYAATGSKTVRIFHSGTDLGDYVALKYISIGVTGLIPNKWTALDGNSTCPSGITYFAMVNQSMSSPADFNLIRTCNLSIRSLVLINNGITSFSINPFAGIYPGKFGLQFNVLIQIDESLNDSPILNLSGLIETYRGNSLFATGGTFVVSQTPPCTPNSTALAILNDLHDLYGWFVTHD